MGSGGCWPAPLEETQARASTAGKPFKAYKPTMAGQLCAGAPGQAKKRWLAFRPKKTPQNPPNPPKQERATIWQ